MIKLKDILKESTQASSSPGTRGYTGFLPSEIWDKYKRELSVSIKNTTGYSIVGLDKIPPDTIKKTDNPINKKDVSDKNISEIIKLKDLLILHTIKDLTQFLNLFHLCQIKSLLSNPVDITIV